MKLLSLDEMKESELETLKIFKEYCDKYNLKYYLTYGTLLGSIRHKGFIPWDDDIDILMPKDDYDFFINNFNNINNREVITKDKNDKYYFNFAKVIDCNTVLIEEYQDIEIGAYIDIFPLSYIVDDKFLCFRTNILIGILSFIYRYISLKPLSGRKYYKNLIIRVINILFPYNDLVKNNIDKLIDKLTSNDKTNTYGITYWTYGLWGIAYAPISMFEPSIKSEFEGELYNCPKDYNNILEYFYGKNYMKLPPKEKQISRHKYICYWKNNKE